MGGKGKSKESKASATPVVDDKAAARAKLRREIQQAKAELAGDKNEKSEKSGNTRWGKREETDRWGKREETDRWGKREADRWGAERWYDETDRWEKRDEGGRWGKRDEGTGRQYWKDTDYNYRATTSSKGSSGNKGSSDYRGRFDNYEKGSTKGSNFGRDQETQSKGKGKSKDRYRADAEENDTPSMSVQDLESRLANSNDVQKAKVTAVTTPLESKGVFCEVK
eukprot:CAMPEP_0169126768 /NCGR_PEP_ID=MMETSP1015-20121227/35632_1 /TAXON_ID=342587 /ORGANISM="Karlodinium micrum, Strain CCMP2283" /LENGTH=223 /DNA_ID=CAMNT_0009190469 /DNA_START=122 /DNA_END=790 /DNA_ORIENTATION=-